MIEIIEAKREHIPELVRALRDHERLEFNTFATDPQTMLTKTLQKSVRAWTALLNEKPVCMWGVTEESILGGGHLWLVTTDAVDEFPLDFLRISFKTVRELKNEFKFLYGYVEDSYNISHRWMKWLGFKPVSFSDLGMIKLHRYELSHGN